MKRSQFTEEQTFYALRQAESGAPIRDLCRQYGNAESTFLCLEEEVRPSRCERTPAAAAAGRREQPIKTAGRGPLARQV